MRLKLIDIEGELELAKMKKNHFQWQNSIMRAAIVFCLLVFILVIFIQPITKEVEVAQNLNNPNDQQIQILNNQTSEAETAIDPNPRFPSSTSPHKLALYSEPYLHQEISSLMNSLYEHNQTLLTSFI